MLNRSVAKSPWPARLILLGAVAAVAAAILFIRSLGGGGQAYTDIQVPPDKHIETIGNDIIYYDGTAIYRVGANGAHRWSFAVGREAGFHCSEKRVVAWSARQLYILDPSTGKPVFNDQMESMVQFARAGNNYVSVFVGEKSQGWVYMLDGQGKRVDSMQVTDFMLLDMGFFSRERELMWAMGLDTAGTVPVVSLQTFDPGSLGTGRATIGEQLAYRVYYHDGKLRVVDTRQIRTYTYQIREDAETPPVLIYGWYMQDVRVINRDLYQLLIPMPREDSQATFTDLRLIHGEVDRVLHLPTDCLGVVLGSKAVYAFSGQSVYTCHYGGISFTATSLPVTVTKVIGVTQDDQAILGDGSSVYVVQLPK